MSQQEERSCNDPIRADMTVDAVVKRYPRTAAVFLRRTMNCPDCHISRFHDIGNASKRYGVDLEALITELNEAVGRTQDHPQSAC